MTKYMANQYEIRLVARNEGIEYTDLQDVYRFNVALIGKEWNVWLPGSRGQNYQTHVLDDEERERILPRIEKYLASRRYFLLVGPKYPVRFCTTTNSAPAQA
jgi:hypothetical protein